MNNINQNNVLGNFLKNFNDKINFNQKLPNEIFDTLIEDKNIKIERIISSGQKTGKGVWLEQDLDEFVIMLTGKAKISFFDSNETLDLLPFDYLFIPKKCKHRVEETDEQSLTFWLAVHFNYEH
jgi:cupin 2 domain-containing protein